MFREPVQRPSSESSDSLSLSSKFKNPGEQFDWSIDRVAIGKTYDVSGRIFQAFHITA